MSRLIAFLLLLPAVLSSSIAHAQVAASATRPLVFSGYATASGAERELGRGKALGGSGGLILEHNRFLALDLRGVLVAARVPLHTLVAEAGPRVAPRYGRFQPYAEVLGGLGHTEYGTAAHPPQGRGFGVTWTFAAGLDLRLKYHLEWRVAEYSYSHIYAGSGASPTILNTGVVYRF